MKLASLRPRRWQNRVPLSTILYICSFLDRCDQFALALTCRHFKPPALKCIWRELNTLKPLLALFPPDAQSSHPHALPTRLLTPSDWKRWKLYSLKIRTLKLDHLPHVTPRTIQLLSLSLLQNEYRLIPFPHHIEIRKPLETQQEVDFLRMLFTESLETLKVGIEAGPEQPLAQQVLGRLCNSLRVNRPALATLSISFVGTPPREGELASLLLEMTSLESLTLIGSDWVDLATLDAIALLPLLRHLVLPAFSPLPNPTTIALTNPLEALWSLRSIRASGPTILHLLPGRRHRRHHPTIEMQAGAACGAPFWSRSELPPSLSKICLYFGAYLTWVSLQIGHEDTSRTHVTSVIAPLLACEELRHLGIEGWLSDCDLERLEHVQNWRKLEFLKLNSVDGGSVPLAAVVALARQCPALGCLRIPVKVAISAVAEIGPQDAWKSMYSMDVSAWSLPGGDVGALAGFLGALSPKQYRLRGSTSWIRVPFGSPDEGRWKAIKQAMFRRE